MERAWGEEEYTASMAVCQHIVSLKQLTMLQNKNEGGRTAHLCDALRRWRSLLRLAWMRRFVLLGLLSRWSSLRNNSSFLGELVFSVVASWVPSHLPHLLIPLRKTAQILVGCKAARVHQRPLMPFSGQASPLQGSSALGSCMRSWLLRPASSGLLVVDWTAEDRRVQMESLPTTESLGPLSARASNGCAAQTLPTQAGTWEDLWEALYCCFLGSAWAFCLLSRFASTVIFRILFTVLSLKK